MADAPDSKFGLTVRVRPPPSAPVLSIALVAELADVADLKSAVRNGVPVRSRPGAPKLRKAKSIGDENRLESGRAGNGLGSSTLPPSASIAPVSHHRREVPERLNGARWKRDGRSNAAREFEPPLLCQ